MATFKARGKVSFGKSRKTRKLRKRSAKPSRAVKSYVNRVVSRNIETKMNDVEQTGKVVYGLISNNEVYSLLPALSMGTGEGNRIGNKVNCKSLTLRMSLYCYNQSTSTPPIYFDIYIFKSKNKQRGAGQPSSTDMAMFLEDGNSSKQYVGTSLDGMRYLNDEMFSICKKKRVCLYNPYSTGISATASINPHKSISFNLTKYVKNTWMFNDTSNDIENDNLYIAVGCTLTSGATLPINSTFGDYSYIVQSKYKDA